jgi:L,D-peptidoglycan transpeptidase YkuD (ErfK/YbiS/YcfS/YnhG family)
VTPSDLVLTPMGLRFHGRLFPCSIGRSGVAADKREGDCATPAGVHRIVGCLYRPDRMARPCDWAVPISPVDLWSDDPLDEDYNLMVRAPHRGRGSAIFLHRWRGPGRPTEGCVALAPSDLRWIVGRIGHGCHLIVPEDIA